jgi:hypothetical protein
MAKFGRYDPRNKKKDRNKYHSINKDLRIREKEGKPGRISGYKVEWVIVDEHDQEDDTEFSV